MSEENTTFQELSQEDKERALKLLMQNKAQRVKEKERLSDPAYKEKMRLASQRATARTTLMVQKATAAGFTVTDDEIDAYLAKKAAK